ncbi:MAG: hypothetical protein AAF214_01235, partial [Pseudomonadota bacterium]
MSNKGGTMSGIGTHAAQIARACNFPGKTALCASLVAFTFVTACAEREVILPGKREAVTSILTSTAADDAAAEEVVNATQSINLPAQVANAEAAQSFGSPEFRTDHPRLGTALTPAFAVNIGAGDSRKHRIVA